MRESVNHVINVLMWKHGLAALKDTKIQNMKESRKKHLQLKKHDCFFFNPCYDMISIILHLNIIFLYFCLARYPTIIIYLIRYFSCILSYYFGILIIICPSVKRGHCNWRIWGWGGGSYSYFLRYRLQNFVNNPQSSGTYRFKNQSATFLKSEPKFGLKNGLKMTFWTYTHVICNFVAMFKSFE